jgi:hypothetical protein
MKILKINGEKYYLFFFQKITFLKKNLFFLNLEFGPKPVKN